jgi:hypothetical protein
MNHSQEPWELREVDGLFAVANKYGFVFDGTDEENRASWERVVLCVNILAPVPTKELKKEGTGLMSDSAVCVGSLIKQRDELIKALKSVKECKYEPDKIICIVDHDVFKAEHYEAIHAKE